MIGLVIPGQADGAYPNGASIVKAVFEEGDANPVGTSGVVLSSHGPIDGEFGYVVEWETMPGVSVFCRGRKLSLATSAGIGA